MSRFLRSEQDWLRAQLARNSPAIKYSSLDGEKGTFFSLSLSLSLSLFITHPPPLSSCSAVMLSPSRAAAEAAPLMVMMHKMRPGERGKKNTGLRFVCARVCAWRECACESFWGWCVWFHIFVCTCVWCVQGVCVWCVHLVRAGVCFFDEMVRASGWCDCPERSPLLKTTDGIKSERANVQRVCENGKRERERVCFCVCECKWEREREFSIRAAFATVQKIVTAVGWLSHPSLLPVVLDADVQHDVAPAHRESVRCQTRLQLLLHKQSSKKPKRQITVSWRATNDSSAANVIFLK